MTIEFHCPQCSKLLRTSDDRAGVKAKCPHCAGPITVPFPEAEEVFDDELLDEDVEFAEAPRGAAFSLPPVTSPAATTRSCPQCGETVAATATRCRHCGEKIAAPPPSAAMPAVAARRGQPRSLDVGDILARSWSICTNQFGMCLAAVWLPGIILGAFSGVFNVVIQVLIAIAAANQNAAALAMGGSLVALLGFGFMAFTCFLLPGQTLMMLRLARGEPTDVSDLFKGGPYSLRMLGATILETLMQWGAVALVVFATALVAAVVHHNQALVGLTVLGGIAFGVAALVTVIVSSWPFRFVLVDQNPPGMSCLRIAIETTRGHRGMTVLLGMVAALVAAAGYLALCVGVLFSVPLAWMMFAVAYCDMTGQPTVRR